MPSTKTRREYVSEEREIDGYVVRAYSILTTDLVVFAAYAKTEGYDDYSSTFTSEKFGRLGQLTTRRPSDEAIALPQPERANVVGQHYADHRRLAERLIVAAFPELVIDVEYGRGQIGLADFHEAITYRIPKTSRRGYECEIHGKVAASPCPECFEGSQV